jgi:hypothetical protein
MLTGGTPKAEVRDISSRLIAMASSKGFDGKEIKLCYVTVSHLCSSSTRLSHGAISQKKLQETNNFCQCSRNSPTPAS